MCHQSCAYTRSKVTLAMKESPDHGVSDWGTVLRHIPTIRKGENRTFRWAIYLNCLDMLEPRYSVTGVLKLSSHLTPLPEEGCFLYLFDHLTIYKMALSRPYKFLFLPYGLSKKLSSYENWWKTFLVVWSGVLCLTPSPRPVYWGAALDDPQFPNITIL